jgi:hypothetical protein
MMKYSANVFLNDLKEADRLKSKQYRSECRKKKRKAYSDGDVRDTAEELFDLAVNSREAYEKMDAKLAVDIAKREYLKYTLDDIRSMVRDAGKLAVKDVLNYWKKEGHIK